ncbi:MAG: ATP-dependent DNA helicase RecG [Firmicutes bacterium]|nr:ATP-dependent DNA helicase RecG [Bacillota bacterium]
MMLQDPITTLKGVGPKKAEALTHLHIETLEDLIMLFPRDYQDRRTLTRIGEMEENSTVAIMGRLERVTQNYYQRGRKQALRLYISDGSGGTQILFFHARYLLNYFKTGEDYAFFGRVTRGRSGLQMVHPDFCRAEDWEQGILPVYPLTKGLTQKELRAWQRQVSPLISDMEDYLDEDFRKRNKLVGLSDAIRTMHNPQDRRSFQLARYRLIFDELFLLQTGLAAVRSRTGSRDGIAFAPGADQEEYVRGLEFPLTGAQRRCVDEIMADLEGEQVMNRLVQGDVGSGKTAVAEIAMYKAVKSGYQAVMMAPTEILARQHFERFNDCFTGMGIRVGFLSSGQKAAERRQTLEDLRTGEIRILIGTHAVIQPDVEFYRLGLVITDEQHRFGVDQRIRLREKGENPNVLVMTATPIPRTLAAVVYGDLDVSVIDEMPPGRKPVKTRALTAKDRDKCYDFVERELAAGHQAYVVTPLIDESETLDVRSAQEVADELTARFDGKGGRGAYKVALLHGAMKQEEKDRIMEAFARGEVDLLVATVVIEVGINVPNATVMVIENAERFGLAQMHQLRGRVGRGGDQAWCFLISGSETETSRRRCAIMQESADGFYIAEEDLKLRGPGDLFGTRQHGLPMLMMADLVRHVDILKHAGDEAKAILAEDPDLSREEHRQLREKIESLFGEGFTLEL